MVAVVVLTSCGGGSTAGGTVADTDISIETTDIESLSVGTEQQCIDRLTKVVNVDYIKEHDVKVDDESSAVFAIENAISEVCADIDSEKGVHAAAHDVVDMVGDKLGEG
jgi:sporulation protein YlmC with PRC-barrel domain